MYTQVGPWHLRVSLSTRKAFTNPTVEDEIAGKIIHHFLLNPDSIGIQWIASIGCLCWQDSAGKDEL